MNDRKQKVLKKAHKLFIEKGFQATSIQDILDYSGISKGTFYNYYSSKNELLMEIFKSAYVELEIKRNELLIGKDRSDIEIFINQIHLQMRSNRENRLISLFEEVIASNDTELKQFIEWGKMKNISWLYGRFIDIFGEQNKTILLDCAIMFMGILRENMKFNHLANDVNMNIERVVRYSVDRIVDIVKGVSLTGEHLIPPVLLQNWLPEKIGVKQLFKDKLLELLKNIKSRISSEEQIKFNELLDFIYDELVDSATPRMYLIESTLESLSRLIDIEDLRALITDFHNQQSVK